MGGGKRLEFRAEFFNLLNHPNWGNPADANLDVNSSNFGRTYTVGTGSTGTQVRASGRSGSDCGCSSDTDGAVRTSGSPTLR